MLTRIKIKGHRTYIDSGLMIDVLVDGERIGHIASDGCFDGMIKTEAPGLVKRNLEIRISGKQKLIEGLSPGLDQDKRQQVINLCYVIDNVFFDTYNVTDIIKTSGIYEHYLNGSSPTMIREEYTNYLGCDGSLKFDFVLPVFAWFVADYKF